MNNLIFWSFFGLVLLFILDIFSVFLLKIKSNHYYDVFHFLGGFLATLFFFSFLNFFIQRKLVFSLTLTLVLGLLWELAEFLFWKLTGKFKPEKADTIKDLFLDIAGGFAGIIFLIVLGY